MIPHEVLEYIKGSCECNGFLTEYLDTEDGCVLKVHRDDFRNVKSFLKYSPEKFIIIRKLPRTSVTVKFDFYHYNEKLVSSRDVRVNFYDNDEIIDNCVELLKSRVELCQGIHIERMVVPDVSKILVENYGNKIIYRSRDCKRVLSNSLKIHSKDTKTLDEGLCEECTSLLNPVVKIEEETEYLQEEEFSENFEEDCSTEYVFGETTSSKPMELSKKRKKKLANIQSTEDAKKSANTYSCNECMIPFPRRKDLTEHMTSSHPNFAVPCVVDDCESMFSEYLGIKMRNHLAKEHLNVENLEIRCTICPTVLTSVKSLQSHQEECAEVFTCQKCAKSYSTYRYFEMHKCKGKVEPSPKVCHHADCAKIFKTKSSLSDHLNSVHSGGKQFICSGCGKAYRNRQKRLVCEKNHMGKFRHHCNLCEKKFNCKRRFTQHMRTHTGEKPFSCPMCSYRCSRLDNLNNHTKKTHDLTVSEAEQATGTSARLSQAELASEHDMSDKDNQQTQVIDVTNDSQLTTLPTITLSQQQPQSLPLAASQQIALKPPSAATGITLTTVTADIPSHAAQLSAQKGSSELTIAAFASIPFNQQHEKGSQGMIGSAGTAADQPSSSNTIIGLTPGNEDLTNMSYGLKNETGSLANLDQNLDQSLPAASQTFFTFVPIQKMDTDEII